MTQVAPHYIVLAGLSITRLFVDLLFGSCRQYSREAKMSLKLLCSNTTTTRRSSTSRARRVSPVRCRCRTSPGPSCSCWRCIRCSSAASSGGFCPLQAAGGSREAAGHVGRRPPEETKRVVSTIIANDCAQCALHVTSSVTQQRSHIVWDGSN